MTAEEMAIIQRGNTEELGALCLRMGAERDEKAAQCAEKDKTIEWQRKMLEEHTTATNNGIQFLVNREHEKMSGNKKRGRDNQAKGADTADHARATRDMETALARVRDRVSHGEKNVIGICRNVCEKFARLSDARNEAGQYKDFAPLTGADEKPIKPATLDRYYRTKYGTAKKRKANMAKNKARTQAARKAKKRTK